jgi:hypothetical protein
MPRNASGTFSLVSGNPVTSGTLIDATWANNTLNDIANEMTDSLSRSGEGGMLAPLRLTDGVQATPGLGFTNEPGSGIYRAGTNEWWSVAGGVQVQQHTANGAVTRFAAGAVGTPSLSAFGDVNTGFWFPAADTVALSTAGAERWRVDSSGNFGVGTSSPGYKLTVQSAIDTYAFNIRDTIGNERVLIGSRATAPIDNITPVQMGNDNTGNLFLSSRTNSASGINFYTNAGTAASLRATLDSSGNLGIGTSSPGAPLNVKKNSAGAVVEMLRLTNDGPGAGSMSKINFDASNTSYAAITGGFGTGGPQIKFELPTATGGSWDWIYQTTTLATLLTSGNFGIGTSSPGERLEVNGAIKTAAPAGGTAASWKLGAVASVSPTSPNRTIEVDIGGTIYYLHAKTTNN